MKRSAGFGLVEILLAASLSAVGLLGFAIVFQRYQLTHKKVEAVLLATGAELDLVLQIENPLTPAYQTPAIQTALANRTSLAGISFPLNIAGVDVPLVADGPTIFVNATGSACTGGFVNPTCAFTDPNCAFVDPNCSFAAQLKTTIIGTGLAARHSFAYQFNINPQWAVVAPLGSKDTFNSYTPSNLYETIAIQQCDTAVPPANGAPGDIAIRGINRTTGQVYCIKKPAAACPPATFPVGTEFIEDFTTGGTSGGRLSLVCQENVPKPSVSCSGSDYVLNSFTADSNGTGGTCVWRTTSPQAWPTIYRSTKKISVGRACPKNYDVKPDCSVKVTAPPPKTTTCGPYTTSWTESCKKIENAPTCKTFGTETFQTNCDTATPPNCFESSYTPCLELDPPTYTYIHHTTAHNNSGTRDFATTVVPHLKQVINPDRNSFTCEIVYPDLPARYQTYQDGKDYLGAANLDTHQCTIKPKWEAAELRVTFSCVLNVDETVQAK